MTSAPDELDPAQRLLADITAWQVSAATWPRYHAQQRLAEAEDLLARVQDQLRAIPRLRVT